jgi:hypothetical protein
MSETYRESLRKNKKIVIEASSVLEDAPYIISRELSQGIYSRGSTCNCASCSSSGGTCRAVPTGLEKEI